MGCKFTRHILPYPAPSGNAPLAQRENFTLVVLHLALPDDIPYHVKDLVVLARETFLLSGPHRHAQRNDPAAHARGGRGEAQVVAEVVAHAALASVPHLLYGFHRMEATSFFPEAHISRQALECMASCPPWLTAASGAASEFRRFQRDPTNPQSAA